MSIISRIFPNMSKPKDLVLLTDDTVLRQLAQDFENRKTKLIFAADMAELFDEIDLHNFCIGDARHIEVKLDPKTVEKLQYLMAYQDLDSSEDKKLIGPTMVDGLVISFGNKAYDGHYRYRGVESYIGIHTNTGIKRHQFGMNSNFADIFNPKPKFSRLENTY